MITLAAALLINLDLDARKNLPGEDKSRSQPNACTVQVRLSLRLD